LEIKRGKKRKDEKIFRNISYFSILVQFWLIRWGASVVQSMAMDRNYGVTITWRCKN